MKTKIVALMNAFVEGKSGGDVCMIESLKRMNDIDLLVVTSSLGKKLCEESRLSAKYYITTSEEKFTGVILTYLYRIFRGVWFLLTTKNYSPLVLYVSSDALPDVLPALFFKLKNSNAKWLQKIFHLIPRQRKLSYLSQKISFKIIQHFADQIVCDSEGLKEHLMRKRLLRNISVNYPGVDAKKIQKKEPSKKRYDALYIGRLHESKGILDLMHIWRIVRQFKKNAYLGIIGTGNIDSMQMPGVDWLGFLNDEKKWAFLKSGNVLLFPSHEEGFGMVIVEALAGGVPVITYDLPAYDIFGQTITKVKLGNTQKFADTVIEILDNPTIVKQKIKQGLQLAKKFSWEKYSKKERIAINKLTHEGVTL